MNIFVNLIILFALTACQVKTQDGASVIAVSSNYSTTLTATSTITADGVAASTISINVKKNGVAAAGETPVFSATGTGNTVGTCSVTDANGDSTCTLKSTKAESKSVAVTTPGVSLPAVVIFTAGSVNSTNTTISASGPTVANGTAAATVSVYVKDAYSNAVAGVTPTFSATDTGSTNIYGACSASSASGLSTCTLKSTKAELKTLSLLTPVSKTGGTAIFMGGTPVAANSTITGSGPVIADGVSTSTITVLFLDYYNNPSPGILPTFTATDTGGQNTYGACTMSGVTGVSTCSLKSKTAETKTLSLVSPFSKSDGTVIFTPVMVVAANSTITGTSPVVANGIATSTVTITLKDASNSPVAGITPTFSATNTGTTNSYGSCSLTNTSGISTCTLSSLTAETKTLSIVSPVSKSDGLVVFTTPTADPANSTITGTTPVVANGTSSSTITVMLKDSSNFPVPGVVPTFSATNTGTTNNYGVCTSTSALGISTCSLSSLTAESKTLSIATPITKSDGIVVFTAPTADPANSTITGSGPVIANGSATSTVTITLKDSANNPVPGQTPTFGATNTGNDNTYGTCSATNASGISTCTLSSLTAETKTLAIATPIIKTDGTVVFTSASASALNSTITGTGPVIANGTATSTITITLKDAGNNPVSGQTPTFDATDTSAGNTYTACSASNASGVSTCTMRSTVAEVKTLSIQTPVIKADGTVTFTAGAAIAANSTITGTGPVIANGTATSTITITLKDATNNPVSGETPTFDATDTSAGNTYTACSASNAFGVSTCTMKSTVAEVKTLSIQTPVIKADGSVTFSSGAAVAANSTITGTGPVIANGTATSTVTITLKDASNNPVSGQTPTFDATDTSAGNTYTACSASDASGVSTCTMKSIVAEVKTLSIQTPVIKADGTVTFTAGAAVAANSTITGTGPVIANGTATSAITITLKDVTNNPVSGQTPTFDATDTSAGNTYTACSASNASGVSTCTMKSTVAEIKTLSIQTPVIKADGTVTFTAGAAIAINSTITGTGPVVANGTATSTVTITLRDASNNPVSGETPTFSATDTATTNNYSTCSVSNALGVSTCTFNSTVAETKTLYISTPVIKGDGTVVFNPGSAAAANSTITGTSPVIANGSATSTVTITLKDIYNNTISSMTPTFDATDTSAGNTYTACSASNALGVSTCTMMSTVAEIKTLSIQTPVIKADGTVTFAAGAAVAANSTITGSGPVVANGTATSTVTITLKDASNNPVSGETPTFDATDTSAGNTYTACSASNASGVSTCTMKSTVAEVKTLSIQTPVIKPDGTVTFTAGAAVAANSTITGTGPVIANGTATSTVTITLKDASNNPVSGETPTFDATDTSAGNTYTACSASNTSGVSTCTMKSTVAEVKTLSIQTPVIKADGTVTFAAGAAVAANSTITGTGPVIANGTATSTVTITLKDASNNPVSGETPTFDATDTSAGNTYTACSLSNASGVSTCTMKSTVAEVKTLSIQTPVIKADGTVTFTAGAAVAANSTITGTGPVIANGTATSTVTITLKDASNNPVSGQTPTFDATDTSAGNTYTACSLSNASGVSTCTMKSTVAEIKTLSIQTPVIKADGTITFTAGAAVAANSTITGTGPVVANGTATSTVTITLKDASNNPVSGQTPTFTATNTATANTYGTCSATNTSGISTCTLASTKAEIKTLSIATPVVKADGTVVFSAGAPMAANSSLTGSSPVVANGSATSNISVVLRDAYNNPVSGSIPTFSATNTGTTNSYGTCTASNTTGLSSCTLASTKAEIKTLSLLTPVTLTGGTVTFSAGAASIANSTIIGTGPVMADGVNASTVIITLKDAFNNPILGTIPTFNATNSGSTNVYGICSSTDSSGTSNCTLTSTMAETKTLSIVTPISKADGTVVFNVGAVSVANSSITATGPVTADGSSTSVVTITLKDATNNPVPDLTPTFSATDTGSTNSYSACSVTDSFGISTCTFTSMSAETKNLTIVSPVHRSGGTVDFIPGAPDAAYSTITGSGPVVADGSTTSTITITILDAFHNPISGETPTFSATNTGSTNNYTTCSATDAFGVSTCTMKSTKAEVKTLSITSPVTKSDGSVTFTAGSAVAANSHITGSGPIPADGSTASTITITLNDAFNNPVSSITPNFSATGSNNGPGICSATDATGVSSCSLTSTTSETKTLSITYPFTKADGTVQFIAGFPVAANSSITGTSTVIANGVATSTITISLNDASNNPVAGQTPTFSATDTGTTNSYGTCSASNTSGISTCTLASTKAEIKTLAIVTPVAKTGGTVTFIAGSVAATYSTIAGTTNITADGIAASTVTVTLYDAFNNPVAGSVPTFNATNTGTTNIYGVCGSSNTSGVSTCSLKSTKAETKTLAITAPVAKTGSTVIFIAGSADSAHSDITGTGPVSADGMSLSFITINLGDAYGNPIVGTIPIFNATDSGTNNIYGACSATNTSGVSSCSLASAMAETKTLQLTSPIAVTGSTTVTFSAGGPTALNSTIVGTSSIVADGSTSSTITITLKDSSNNVVPGWTPTFDATDTGSTNGYIDCSMSDPFGVSICYLTSTKAEAKTLRITSPVTKLGSVVTFIAGSAVAANSSISGTSPTTANGMDLSTITINLKDNYNNPVAGTIPTFSATNTGTTNVYGVCSSTDALGNSTCSLKSTKAESKIPQILTPVSKSGGAISFNPDLPSATNTTISGTGPVNPDGTSTSTITITIKDAYNNPISGTIPTFSATGANNSYGICSSSNTSGSSTCTMASTTAQIKTLSLLTPISVSGGTVEFKTGSAVVANSTITGTGPVKADGILTSTITITLKDSLNLPVTGEIPVFSASGTGNTISTCSATNSFGVSTCTLKSTKAEIKTLSITSPIVKPNGTVTFIPGDPSVASSTIVASGPCKATGTDVCSVTITIKDAQGNAISGSTPTFSLSGTLNTLNACSVTNSSGISTCGATSTKAESKTFQLLTPVSVAGNSVDFNPNGINIQVPIEMLDRGISSKTTALTFARSRTTLNTNDYVGQMTTYQFEIVADNTNATIAYNVSLVNSLGTIVPGSSISVPPATTTKRFNITWTPTSGADNYRVQIAAASGSNIVKVHSARIIVEQTAAIETKIYIPLVGGDATGETNVDTTAAAATSVTGTSLAQTPVNNYYPWTRTDTKYDTIASGNSWTLEAVIASNATSATATAQLVDSGGLTIGSALTATATTPTLVSTSFASTATNFNDGDVLSLKLKSSTATNIAYVFRAGLWVKLKFLKKTEIPFRLLNRRSASTTAIMPDARFLWDAGAWSNPTTYFEIYAMKSSGTSTISLMDHSNIDNGTTSPTPTAVSTLTPPTAYGVYRSPTAITLTDMDRYIIQHVSTSTTAHVMGGAFVIIQARD